MKVFEIPRDLSSHSKKVLIQWLNSFEFAWLQANVSNQGALFKLMESSLSKVWFDFNTSDLKSKSLPLLNCGSQHSLIVRYWLDVKKPIWIGLFFRYFSGTDKIFTSAESHVIKCSYLFRQAIFCIPSSIPSHMYLVIMLDEEKMVLQRLNDVLEDNEHLQTMWILFWVY